MASVRSFLEQHFLHFNSREVVAAAHGWERHLAQGGEMMLTLAGAMSAARLGRLIARMIRAGKVHAISCTGANLEEDLFNLFAGPEYEIVPEWRSLTAEREKALYDRGMNRVTDTCIPETVMREMEKRLIDLWSRACAAGERRFPSEFLFRLLDEPGIETAFTGKGIVNVRAEQPGDLRRVLQAFLGGIGRRHHDAMDPRRAQGVDGGLTGWLS